MKKIKDLIDTNLDITIKGITDDSRDVKEGYLFVATHGFHVDHFDYIEDAIKKGCVFLVVDREIEIDFPHLVVDSILDTYKELCSKFYDVNLSDYHFIGITGTDGKTTTSTIVKDIIGDCAYIGTNGVTIGDETIPTNNTTPCISELYEDISRIGKSGLTNISMEVSSEALLHDRVSHFQFDIVAFTNITGDHLNVHGSFDEYRNCKLKLLDYVKKDGFVFVNGDDPNLQNIHCSNLYTFGFDSCNDIVITDVKYGNRDTDITVKNIDHIVHLHSPLIGKYNVYNVVLAYLIGLKFGIDESTIIDRIKKLKPIKGRCEFLDFGQNYDIVLDYAHTINGVNTILDTFQNYPFIITVTGAAGGREHEKRPIIGKNVIEKSDISIFTMDDPRYEDVNEIIDQMVGKEKDYVRIPDREDAICYALSIAPPKSVVLIIGKGRDNYMAIEDKKVPYNDYDVVQRFFNKKS